MQENRLNKLTEEDDSFSAAVGNMIDGISNVTDEMGKGFTEAKENMKNWRRR